MIWLLTAWGGVKRLFGVAARYPLQAALIALLCLSAWLHMGKQNALDTVAERDDTIAAMIKASKEARAAQIALNKANTDKQIEIARKADNDKIIRRDIADRSRAYADRMRAGAYCRKASATTEDSSAEVDTSASADAVVVSADDFRILTDNTARLVLIKAWGDDLVKAGLAVQSAPEQP